VYFTFLCAIYSSNASFRTSSNTAASIGLLLCFCRQGGGAIRNEYGKFVITDSEFEGNTASDGNNINNASGDVTCDDNGNTFESPDVTSLANDSQGNYPADICAS
jgi:hypothetical protein